MLRVVVALLLATGLAQAEPGSWRSSSPQPGPKDQHVNDKSHQRGAQDLELVQTTLVGRIAAWDHDDWIAAGTLVIALFTVVLGTGTVVLVRDGRRHSERQLRAYVGVDTGSVLLEFPSTTTAEIGGFVRFQNYGLTPAYNFKAWLRVKILPADKPAPFLETNFAQSISVLGPGASVDQEIVYSTLASNDIDRIFHEKAIIYVWGRADYLDAFGKPRWFVYRTSMSGTTKTLHFTNRQPGKGWPLRPDESGYEAN